MSRPGPAGRLVHCGNAVVDRVVRVPALPEHGGDVVATGWFDAVGGGFTTMAAAARQGAEVVYAGMHGTGPRGDLVRAAMGAEGVGVLQPALAGTDTGEVLTLVDAAGERTFVTLPGAEGLLDEAAAARIDARPGDVVHLTGYSLAHRVSGATLAAWAPALPDGVVVVLDPGPLVASLPADRLGALLDRADWCTVNAAEAAALTGRAEPAAAAAILLRRTGRSGVLVRAGADGCVLARAGEALPLVVPAPVVEAVDLTGAGDTHAGAFVAALLAGAGPADAVRRANAAAAVAVTRWGPATGPGRDELDALLASGPTAPSARGVRGRT